MTWNRIWSDYVGQNPLFWGLHLAVGILTVGWTLRHLQVLLSIRGAARTEQQISEYDVSHHSANARSYLPAYDYFCSAFVLTGLLGTIYGFFIALSADSRTFNTSAISRALVTSGFGIALALLTGLVSSLMERWCARVPKWFPHAAAAQHVMLTAVESLGLKLDTIASAITGLTGSFQTVFEGGSKSFADASLDIAQAAQQLRQSVEAAAGSFTRSIEEAAKTAERLDGVLDRTLELPAQVATALGEFSEQHCTRLDETSRQIAVRLDSTVQQINETLARTLEVPAQVAAALNEFSESHRDKLEETSQQIAARLDCTAQQCNETLARALEVPAQVAKVLDQFSEDQRSKLEETSQHIAARLDCTVQKFDETLTKTLQVPAKVGSALEELSAQHQQALASFTQGLLGELHAATASVAAELDKTKGLPAELAAEMCSTHQAFQSTIDGVAKTMEQLAAAFQDAIREALDAHERHAQRAAEEQAKQMTLLISRLSEWTDQIKNLPAGVARALAEEQAEGRTKLNETTARIWQEAVRVLDDATDKLEKEADRLEGQRTELYKEETDRIRERFTGILKEVDKLAEGIRSKALEAFTQGAGDIPAELQKFGTRVPELAASVLAVADETRVATTEFRTHAKVLSEEVTRLRVEVSRLASPAPAPVPRDGQLLASLQQIEAGLAVIAEQGVILRRPVSKHDKLRQPNGGFWNTVKAKLRFGRGR